MADEDLASLLGGKSEKKLKDDVNTLSEIVENLMKLIYKLPDMLESSINPVAQGINNLRNYISGLEAKTSQIEQYLSTQGATQQNYNGNTAAPPMAPVSVPVPPAAPRLAPPPGIGAKPAPEKPQDLRVAIMTELKSVFANRRAKSE